MPPVIDSYADPGTPDHRSAGRYLWWLLMSQRGRTAGGALLGTVWMVLITLTPYVLSRAIDDGLEPGRMGALTAWSGVLLGLGVVNAWVSIMRHRTMTRLRMDATFRTVKSVVGQATRLGAALPRQARAGEVVTIGVTDVQQISQSLTMTGPGFGSVIAYLVVAGLLLSVSVSLALVVLLGVPVIAVLVGPLLGRLRGAEAVYREQQGGLTARIGDLSGGLRVLNGLGGKQLFADSFRRDSGELTGQGYRVGAVTSWVQALGVGLPMVFLALVTWLAARLAVEGSISVGEFVGVYGYVAVLVVPVAFFIECGYDVTRGLVAAKRVVGFLSLVPDSALRQARTDPPAAPSALRDPGSGVEVAPGTLTALVSGRPAESAEVVDRLCGFAPGAVTWGPVRLDEVAAAQVRDRILVADNEADLFAGPLRDMVSGRRHHDDEAVARAVHAAVAQDIVEGLPDGLGTAMDAQARNLSGGQRQRIRLVRALLAEPEVLMAVEPTSALDAHTEAAVAARLRTARTGRTTVVTGTSPVLLDQADTVHYLVDGKVVASGSHRDLLRREPGYRSLVDRSAAEADAPQVPAQLSPADGDDPGRTDQDPGGTASVPAAAGVADGGADGGGTGARVGMDRTGARGPGGDNRSPAREAAGDHRPGAGPATGGQPPGDGPRVGADRTGARGPAGDNRSPAREAAGDHRPDAGPATGGQPPGDGPRVGADRTGGRGPGGDNRSPAREAASDHRPDAGPATGGQPPGDGPPAAAGRPGARGNDGNRDGRDSRDSRDSRDEYGTGDAGEAHRSGSGEVV